MLVWMIHRELNPLPKAKIESRFLGQLSRGQVTVLEVSRLQTCACVRAREIRGSRSGADRL